MTCSRHGNERCQQNYSNIELLLVDDGSTDLSGNICDEYVKKDNRINVSYKLSDVDKNTIDYLIKKLTIFASSYGLEFQFNEQIDYTNHEFFKDVAHHMGGTIIDSPSYPGTVDNNLKILGCQNIYICSSSVFPTSGSVNPNNTIVGLGLRLGDHINSLLITKYEVIK